MRHSALIVFSIALCLLLSSCEDDPLAQAEEQIAADNYSGALKILDGLNAEGLDKKRYHRLRALALFVESRFDEGFNELLLVNDGSVSQERPEDARLLFRAAAVIIREKERYPEVIMLLDSSLIYDISIKDDIIKLVWDRSLEYLGVPGIGGYYLAEFASRFDEQTSGKLKGQDASSSGIYARTTRRLKRHRVIYYNRYQEMKKMHENLILLAKGVDAFMRKKDRLPQNIQELQSSDLKAGGVISSKGWRIRLISKGNGDYRLIADALKNNPGEVLVGTTITYP